MRYFGNPCTQMIRDGMAIGLLDYIDTPGQRNIRFPDVIWCADNGAFASNYPGDDVWFEWLSGEASDAATCAFAVAPDVVGNAVATLEKSRPWLSKIRDLGFPAAFVGQDGQEVLDTPWDEFDAFFIGGTTDWKLGPDARELAEEAKARGKHLHMGRVNSLKRLRYAQSIGCDSVDGTYLVFAPDTNFRRLVRWLISIGAYG